MRKYLSYSFVLLFVSSKAFSQTGVSDQSIQNDFQNYVNSESSKNYSGSYMSVFSTKENTVGSRYLFDKWMNGVVVNTENVIVNTDSFQFNFDKISGKFLAIQTKKKMIIEVNDSTIRSFTIINGNDSTVFEKMPLIGDNGFYVALVKNKDHYSLYKSLKTKLEKSNYYTNGIFESGKKYDEFIDQANYYIVFPGEKEFKQVPLKRKAVKEVLSAERQKVKYYLSKFDDDTVSEILLMGLIYYVNQ